MTGLSAGVHGPLEGSAPAELEPHAAVRPASTTNGRATAHRGVRWWNIRAPFDRPRTVAWWIGLRWSGQPKVRWGPRSGPRMRVSGGPVNDAPSWIPARR